MTEVYLGKWAKPWLVFRRESSPGFRSFGLHWRGRWYYLSVTVKEGNP